MCARWYSQWARAWVIVGLFLLIYFLTRAGRSDTFVHLFFFIFFAFSFCSFFLFLCFCLWFFHDVFLIFFLFLQWLFVCLFVLFVSLFAFACQMRCSSCDTPTFQSRAVKIKKKQTPKTWKSRDLLHLHACIDIFVCSPVLLFSCPSVCSLSGLAPGDAVPSAPSIIAPSPA